jgi:GTP cyclohydrolase I
VIDLQSGADQRRVPLEQVGVRDLLHPLEVTDRGGARQSTVARVSMAVSLPHHFRATHMSRFLQVLNQPRQPLTLLSLLELLTDVRQRLEAESAHISITFPYFLQRRAPASGQGGLLDYECTFAGSSKGAGTDLVVRVKVPVTSVCPCSKAISDYGAHNQRSYVTVEVKPTHGTAPPWLEDLIQVAESSASAPIYPILKRDDERHVTMQAFDNPTFVEDSVRNVALHLSADYRVQSFTVEAVNQESIHNHNAFARTSWERSPRS